MSTRSEANQLEHMWLSRKKRNTSNLLCSGENEHQAKLARMVEAKTREPIVLKSGLYNNNLDMVELSGSVVIKEEQSKPQKSVANRQS